MLEELPDSNRAKFLAANSYIETNKPDNALKIAKALKNKELQIASLKKKIKMVEKDKSIDEKEKESQIDDINKLIKDLKK